MALLLQRIFSPFHDRADGVRRSSRVLLHAVALYLVTVSIYVASPVRVHSDTIWSIPTAVSLLDRGSAALDEYRPTIAQTNYGTYEVNGHSYNYFPLGPSLVALPVLFVFDRAAAMAELLGDRIPKVRDFSARWRSELHQVGLVNLDNYVPIEGVVAAILVSGAVIFVFLTAQLYTSVWAATAVALVFAFGTSAYSTASRLLWQHTPSLLALSAIVYILARPVTGRLAVLITGILAGAAYVVRPTNSISVIFIALYFGALSLRMLATFLVGAAALLIPFVLYNMRIYSALLPPYFRAGRLSVGWGHFVEALLGNLISPGRGLFVYSPVILLGAYGFYRRRRDRGMTHLDYFFLIIIIGHLVAVSTFSHWWAGHSFGPRFLTDVLPYLMYFVIYVVDHVSTGKTVRLGLTLLAMSVFSCFVHFRGATAWGPWHWNDTPVNVDQAPDRVWNWRDLQFLRGGTS